MTMEKDPFDLKEGTALHEVMENSRERQEKASRSMGLLDEDDDLVFRGFALIFTDEDETFQMKATHADDDWDEDEYG